MITPHHHQSETTVPGKDKYDEVTVEYNSETGNIVLRTYPVGAISLCSVSARTLAKSLDHFAMCSEVRRTVRGSK